MRKSLNGFTIVELLIVIVVIAILAAITIVAFRGIQDRANDSAVQADMNAFVKKMELYKIDNDGYPIDATAMATVGARVSAGAYTINPITNRNFVFCKDSGATSGTTANYTLLAKSKSGNAFMISNTNRVIQAFTGTWGLNNGGVNLCANIYAGAGNGNWVIIGYDYINNPGNGWASWTAAS